MTKKFWNDWKKRIGETENILVYCVSTSGTRYRWAHPLVLSSDDEIVHVSMHGDAADVTVERHHPTLRGTMHVENEYVTVHREDVKTIIFKKPENN